MSYLLGVTVGPVQTYIEESRKLLDLYNSSKIISDIMKKIMELINSKNVKNKLIYPNHEVGGADYSNYMVIKIENKIDMKDIENSVYEYFNEFMKKTVNGIDFKYDIREIFHMFWAMKEIKGEKYGEIYSKLMRLIRSLKNTYDFHQREQNGGRKCIICGKYNICTEGFSSKNRRKYNLSPDEELCPFCLFKRKYNTEKCNMKKLESVYTVAIKIWKEKNIENLKDITETLEKVIEKGKEDRYYSKPLIKKIIKISQMPQISQNKSCNKKFINEVKDDLRKDRKSDSKEDIEIFKDMRDKMEELYYNNNEIKSPNYEYCFIQFDIDNLGKWISGKYLDDKTELEEYQENISGKIVEFGKKLKQRLEDDYCDVIYSGGDDFLGALPNEAIISVVGIIDDLFKEEVQDKIKGYKGIDRKITYSMSITIAQCKDPMSYSLRKTREELKNVKKRYEDDYIPKDGIAINYIINNGKEITCYLKKSKLKVLFDLAENFNCIKNYISFSYINNFEDEMLKLDVNDITFEEMENFYSIANCEFKRLVSRSIVIKKNDRKKDKSDLEKKIEVYVEKILDFFNSIVNENCIEVKSNVEYIDFENIMNILKINKKLSSIEFK